MFSGVLGWNHWFYAMYCHSKIMWNISNQKKFSEERMCVLALLGQGCVLSHHPMLLDNPTLNPVNVNTRENLCLKLHSIVNPHQISIGTTAQKREPLRGSCAILQRVCNSTATIWQVGVVFNVGLGEIIVDILWGLASVHALNGSSY